MAIVAVLDDDAGRAAGLAPWDRLGPATEVHFLRRIADTDELAAALRDAEVVVVMRERTQISRGLLDQLPQLRLLVTTGMANAAIDFAAAHERGVTVAGTSSAGQGVTELAWGLVIAVVKGIVTHDRAVRDGRWQEALPGDLYGRTLGLYGFGRLGKAMVPAAEAFGMRTIAWSDNLDAEVARAGGAELVERGQLFADSDVLSIHTRLSDRTRGAIGAAELSSMRSTAVLINTSRGPIVDERALVDALQQGVIRGAGLDVFDIEPLPAGHPFTKLANVVLAPHLGYASEANVTQMYSEAIEDILGFWNESPLRVISPI